MTSVSLLGIHGLGNKPEESKLSGFWQASIEEGLRRNQANESIRVELSLVFWAHMVHAPLLTEATDPEPYLLAEGGGPLARAPDSVQAMAIALKKEAGGVALDRLSRAPVARDLVPVATEKRTPDLHRYYDPQDALAGNVRGLLEARLLRAHESGRPIVLLAHSMGSIIAYDVLCDLAKRTSVTIDHFITFGSPLGLSEVKRHQRQEPRAVPGNVRRWTNLADRRDFVALDSKLATDYSANRAGVRINDVPVVNGYVERKGKANPHKIYGYLRTPEFTALLVEAAH